MKLNKVPYCFEPIGFVQSPFLDKFGVPRQPGLAIGARGILKLEDDPDLRTALRGLEEFSHLWIVFVFHEHGGKKWKPSIRPPRLGGARKVGVLSSRSPHRPNPIGLSAVQIDDILLEAQGGPEIHVRGLDLLDGTPILDLKPYLPYADAIPEASAGWAAEPITRYPVRFSAQAEDFLIKMPTETRTTFRELVIQILELDPRPAFQQRQRPVADHQSAGMRYGFDLVGKEVKYEIREGGFLVIEIQLLGSQK